MGPDLPGKSWFGELAVSTAHFIEGRYYTNPLINVFLNNCEHITFHVYYLWLKESLFDFLTSTSVICKSQKLENNYFHKR